MSYSQIPTRSELEAADAELLEGATSAAVFEQSVRDAGGHVDFIFGDNRPFDSCHASTIAHVGDGILVCAWFGGTEESADDVAIWLSRLDGESWSAPERVAKISATAHWNPVLFAPGDGNLHLFFKVGPEIPEWQTWWMTSSDGGVTWSEPVELVPGDYGGRGPVRCKPIVLADGAWLAGASTERGIWKPFADRTDDRGKTWTRSADFRFDRKVIKVQGAIQPTLWESEAGRVHALMRTNAGVVVRADSTDGGRTWSGIRRTGLPNNNSGVDAVAIDGALYLVFNPVRRNWGPRTPLSLAVSHDNGETWVVIAHLEDDSNEDVEYSYPAAVAANDGIAVSYTWNRERIRVWRIPFAALR